jgi:hypothetical protein
MNRTLKTFLIWLLMAMLPLHAVAGSLGMSCAPVHRQSGQDAMRGAMSHHAMMADAHAGHGAAQADQALDPGTDKHAPDSKAAKQAHSSCSACSAFCAGAVAPPSVDLPVPTFDGTDALSMPSSVFAVGFIEDGPQRPPRPLSA